MNNPIVTPAPLERFGRFELTRKIGQGGMAEIFLARDPSGALAGDFVIKRMHRELERQREAVELFTTEADVTLLLSHPGVVKVFESGEADGRYYIAMEYIRGWTLEQVFEKLEAARRPLAPDVAVEILIQTLGALDYVHNAKLATGRPLGLIHRDVTPSNIYVTFEGRVKLGDFGVAKLVGVESWTMAGSIKGKIGYLAPEQVLGLPVDQSIDRYSAAIVLYELLTARRCYDADTELDMFLKIRDAKFIKPRKVNPAIPRALGGVVEKALRKRVWRRYKSAKHFRDALVDYRDRFANRVLDVELAQAMLALGLSAAAGGPG